MLEMLDSSTLDNTSSFAFHSGLYLVWLISTLRDRSMCLCGATHCASRGRAMADKSARKKRRVVEVVIEGRTGGI